MLQKLFRLPVVDLSLRTAEVYGRAGIARSAAALSYFLILTIFPLLLCVNYFIGLFHLNLEQILQSLSQLLPAGALAVMEDYLTYAAESQSATLFWAGLVTIVISASAGLRTLFQAMDEVYGVEGSHPVARFFFSVGLSLLFLLTIYLSVVVIFTGDWFFGVLEENLPLRLVQVLPLSALSRLWQWMRYLLLFCFVLLLVLVVYRVGAPYPQVRNRTVLCSAVCSAGALVAASAVFSWFIGMSSRYALVYGSLASLIILLVWLYFCGNILLLGAVVSRVYGDTRGKK